MVIFADAHHQLGVRVVAINEKEIDRCISKRAYFDREKNRLIILSVSEKCDEQFMDFIPEELRVHIINTVKDYEEGILRRSHELCKLSIVEDVNEETVKWLGYCYHGDHNRNTLLLYKEKKQKQKQQEKQQSQQQGQQMSLNTSSEELHKMTDHTTSTLALTIQATSSSDLNLIQNHTKTEKKARMKQNKLEEITSSTNLPRENGKNATAIRKMLGARWELFESLNGNEN
ncbi:hypothetical protein DINM_004326 [Dirofilaria immitis]|nr:hypothetical protein [Dirofilaria immitis]